MIPTTQPLPRLLVVSEVTFNSKLMGAGRTLFNLFDTYPADRLMVYAPEKALRDNPPDPPFGRLVASFRQDRIPQIPNRLGKFVNGWLASANLQALAALPIPELRRLEEFAPEVVLVCPIGARCLVVGQKVISHFGRPSLVYFMDDWMAADHQRWFTSSVQEVTGRVLKDASGWLMISRQLGDILAERYNVKPARHLVVHNPFDIAERTLRVSALPRRGTFQVLYAGSVWAMHYDAVAAVAQAVAELKTEGKDIEFVLHTDEGFWKYHLSDWQRWGVRYGSHIPYEELQPALRDADLLLVASSFLPEHSSYSRSSVQTKLTDYMASGTPVLACGPSYSACNQFVREWDLGVLAETTRITDIKQLLTDQMRQRNSNRDLNPAERDALRAHFGKEQVCARLYDFIRRVACDPGLDSARALAT